MSLMEVWISQDEMVVGDTSMGMDLLKTRISLTKLLGLADLLEIPVSGWTIQDIIDEAVKKVSFVGDTHIGMDL